jgi:hypothetical protein
MINNISDELTAPIVYLEDGSHLPDYKASYPRQQQSFYKFVYEYSRLAMWTHFVQFTYFFLLKHVVPILL